MGGEDQMPFPVAYCSFAHVPRHAAHGELSWSVSCLKPGLLVMILTALHTPLHIAVHFSYAMAA